MREIKFRAWDKTQNKMITNFQIPESKHFGNYRMAISFSGEIFAFTDWDNVNFDEDKMKNSACYVGRFEVMQFTGLKDKNGKGIYEGDIVIVTNANGWDCKAIVEFTDGCFDVKFEWPLYDSNLRCSRKKDYLKVFVANHAVKVLGNIYDNPELLEKGAAE